MIEASSRAIGLESLAFIANYQITNQKETIEGVNAADGDIPMQSNMKRRMPRLR